MGDMAVDDLAAEVFDAEVAGIFGAKAVPDPALVTRAWGAGLAEHPMSAKPKATTAHNITVVACLRTRKTAIST